MNDELEARMERVLSACREMVEQKRRASAANPLMAPDRIVTCARCDRRERVDEMEMSSFGQFLCGECSQVYGAVDTRYPRRA
jgi:hypothetical protein